MAAIPLLLAACSADPNSEPASPSTTQAAALTNEQAPSAMKASPTPSQAPSSSSPTAATSPHPSTTIQPPVPSDAAQENSFDGAEAYAHFLFQAWWYLINTHNIEWWDENFPDCEWKQQMRDTAVDKIEKGVTNELSAFTPRIVDSRMNPDNHSEFVVTLQADLGAIFTLDRDGNKTTSVPPETHQFAVRLLFSGDAWDVVALVNKEAPGQTR
ncbi:DUF6318 family protein [Buchananella felis]|uniref:DUF6318 family protein n=1 Tax=Buchananella felis TaxID=3231492 RepID=UPI003528EC7B